MKSWSDEQYSFKKGRGTVEAIKKIVEAMDECKGKRAHLKVVGLDLKNAFNTASAPVITNALATAGLVDNLPSVCDSFMGGRERERTECMGKVTKMIMRE